MCKPFARQRTRNRQEIVAMLQRQMGFAAVVSLASEPFGEEALLFPALTRKIATEERSERSVGFDAIVKSIDEHIDRGTAADARKETIADEGARSLWMGEESTVLHFLTIIIGAHRANKPIAGAHGAYDH